MPDCNDLTNAPHPPPPPRTMALQDLIAAVNERLTPTERRIARIVLEDPTLLAFGTVSDLAERVETSRPSIVRFATKLGFEGYADLQAWIRDGVSRQLSSPSERVRHQDDSSGPVRSALEQAIRGTFEALDDQRLESLAAPIADGRHVWIVSGETSMAGGHALHSGLTMVRPDVRLVLEHSAGRELASAGPEDTAVIFDFARYRRYSVTAARVLANAGVSIVAITDGPLSPLASLTQNWCELKVPAVGPFDSSVPAVTVAELLVAKVVSRLGASARERIDRLEALWQATGVFVE